MTLTNGSVVSLSIPLRPAPLRRVPEEDGAAAGDDEVTEDFAVFFDVPLLTGPGKAAANGSNTNDARSVVVPALPNTDLNLYLLGGYDTTKPLPFHISYDASRLAYDGPAPWYTHSAARGLFARSNRRVRASMANCIRCAHGNISALAPSLTHPFSPPDSFTPGRSLATSPNSSARWTSRWSRPPARSRSVSSMPTSSDRCTHRVRTPQSLLLLLLFINAALHR
jgi:hypothetical protein